jgi:hypothetical protein
MSVIVNRPSLIRLRPYRNPSGVFLIIGTLGCAAECGISGVAQKHPAPLQQLPSDLICVSREGGHAAIEALAGALGKAVAGAGIYSGFPCAGPIGSMHGGAARCHMGFHS